MQMECQSVDASQTAPEEYPDLGLCILLKSIPIFRILRSFITDKIVQICNIKYGFPNEIWDNSNNNSSSLANPAVT